MAVGGTLKIIEKPLVFNGFWVSGGVAGRSCGGLKKSWGGLEASWGVLVRSWGVLCGLGASSGGLGAVLARLGGQKNFASAIWTSATGVRASAGSEERGPRGPNF